MVGNNLIVLMAVLSLCALFFYSNFKPQDDFGASNLGNRQFDPGSLGPSTPGKLEFELIQLNETSSNPAKTLKNLKIQNTKKLLQKLEKLKSEL